MGMQIIFNYVDVIACMQSSVSVPTTVWYDAANTLLVTSSEPLCGSLLKTSNAFIKRRKCINLPRGTIHEFACYCMAILWQEILVLSKFVDIIFSLESA